MNEEKIVLSTNYAKIIQDDETLCIAEIDLLHTGGNRNNTVISRESVVDSLDTFYNKPIVCILDSEVKSMAKDYTTHAHNGFDESQRMCVGVIPLPEVSNPRWYVDDNGYEILRMNVFLWKYYAEDVVRILANKDGKSKVSIEIMPIKSEKDMAGKLIINSFNFIGVSLLGDKITEAIEGSHLEVIKFSLDETLAKSNEYIEKNKNVDIFEAIKSKKGDKQKMAMGHRELENHLWAILSGQMYTRDKETYSKYSIEEIYPTHLVVYDNETNEEVKFKYEIDGEGVAHIDFSTRKIVDRDKAVRVYAVENAEIGTKEALKIDKSKISDDPWESVDKGNLRKRVVSASNFKTIAKDVFLDLRDGWENGEVTKLKYPVMQIVDDTLIYNRGALASAKAYATKNNETAVLEKLKAIYKKFKLEFENEDSTNGLHECGKFDYEDDKPDTSETKTDKQDKDNGDTKPSEPKAVDDGNKDAVQKMSADANVDPSAQAEMLDKLADQNKGLAEEQNPTLKAVADNDNNVVIAELADLREKVKKYEKELADLRKYKADMEERQKLFKVEEVLNECSGDLAYEKVSEFKANAKNYSIENIDIWANAVRAEAFKHVKQDKPNTFQRMDVWQQHTETQSNSLWSCAKK